MRTVRAAIALAAFLLPMPQPQPSFALAIRHARVVHGDGSVTPRATVFVASGRIARIDDTRAADDVAAAREILAGGRTLIPGLIDAHVHVEPWTLPLFLRYGVTGVRDVHNAPALVFSLAGADVPDRPRVVAAGAMLDGPGSFWPNAMIVDDAASRDRDRLRKAHDDFLDGWTAFELEWLSLSPASLDEVARQLIARGVTIVPTLALHEAFSRLADPALLHDPALADVPATTLKAWAPEDLMGRARWTAATLDQFKRALPVLQRFVGRYAALGGRVAAGTDTAQQFVVPGASLHRELELYVAAGLSPARALRSATADAADLLGISARAGTIAVGKDADLVLIDGDPLADIRATRRILTVIRLGVVVR
jgi:hypothetical protein